MKNKSVAIFYLVFAFLLILTGCSAHIVPVEKAQEIKDYIDFLELLGEPKSVEKEYNGSEHWTYIHKECSFLWLQCAGAEYDFVFTQYGQVVEKHFLFFHRQRSFLPMKELAGEFNQSK